MTRGGGGTRTASRAVRHIYVASLQASLRHHLLQCLTRPFCSNQHYFSGVPQSCYRLRPHTSMQGLALISLRSQPHRFYGSKRHCLQEDWVGSRTTPSKSKESLTWVSAFCFSGGAVPLGIHHASGEPNGVEQGSNEHGLVGWCPHQGKSSLSWSRPNGLWPPWNLN